MAETGSELLSHAQRWQRIHSYRKHQRLCPSGLARSTVHTKGRSSKHENFKTKNSLMTFKMVKLTTSLECYAADTREIYSFVALGPKAIPKYEEAACNIFT